jgi:hypothetical protein
MPGWADDLAPLDLDVRPTCVVMNSICGKFLRPPAQLLKPSYVGYHIPIMSREYCTSLYLSVQEPMLPTLRSTTSISIVSPHSGGKVNSAFEVVQEPGMIFDRSKSYDERRV